MASAPSAITAVLLLRLSLPRTRFGSWSVLGITSLVAGVGVRDAIVTDDIVRRGAEPFQGLPTGWVAIPLYAVLVLLAWAYGRHLPSGPSKRWER